MFKAQINRVVSSCLIILVLLAGASFVFIPVAYATGTSIVQVQAPKQYNGGGTVNNSGVLLQAPTAGNTLIAVIQLIDDGSPGYVQFITQTGVSWSKVTESNSSSWVNGVYNNYILSVEILVGNVSAGASANFIVTTTNLYSIAILAEYSGIKAVGVLSTTATAATGTNLTTGIITSTTAPILCIGGIAAWNANQTASTNGFTLYGGVANSSYLNGVSYLEKSNQILSSVVSNTTADAPCHWAGAIATFAASSSGYTYTFNGVYDENIGAPSLIGDSNVTAYFNDGTAPYLFNVNGSFAFTPFTQPQYFYYTIWPYANTTDTTLHREFWLGTNETSGTYNIYGNPQGLINIVFTIRALGGAGLSNVLTVERYISGSLQVVEKRPIDSTGIVTLALQPYTIYTVIIGEGATTTTFQNINVYTTPIVLTVSALSFPDTVLRQYKYLRIWAARATATDITINYQDTNLQTVSVAYQIKLVNGTVVYSATNTGLNNFTDVWTSAYANTTYYLTATITQTVFGVTTFAQVLSSVNAPVSPLDLSVFGVWPVDPTQIIWVLIVLAVFLCFSVLNVYIGAFAGVTTAAIFVWQGWLHIPAASVTAAFGFVIVIAIAFWKRRNN